MNFFTQWMIAKLLFGMTLFFAAAPPVLGSEGADLGGDDLGYGDDGASAAGDGDVGVDGAEPEAQPDVQSGDDEAHQPTAKPADKEEPEVSQFKGLASARVRQLTKEAPELAQVFQKYPQVQAKFEATLRRDAAYRDAFPTVAEANQMRAVFPNGLADVQALQADVKETEELDRDFYGKDREGNYPGHGRMLQNMYQSDRDATVAMLRSVPTHWAKLDPESYNDAFSQIIGATFAADGVPAFINDLVSAAKEAKQDGLATQLQKLANWAGRFSAEKPKPSAEQERLQRDRETFNREKQDRAKEDGQKFHQTFLSESRKLQNDIISNHPAIKKMAASIPPEKRQKIVDEIRSRMEKLLGKSPSFMRKLKPAYEQRNINETTTLQRAAWSQPWLLNKMVREVLRVETPAMVTKPIQKRAAAAPAKPAGEQKHTKPYQVGKNWHWPDGSRMSVEDILRGKNEQ